MSEVGYLTIQIFKYLSTQETEKMSNLQTQIPTDTWIYTSWNEYEQITTNLLNKPGKSHYYKG